MLSFWNGRKEKPYQISPKVAGWMIGGFFQPRDRYLKALIQILSGNHPQRLEPEEELDSLRRSWSDFIKRLTSSYDECWAVSYIEKNYMNDDLMTILFT